MLTEMKSTTRMFRKPFEKGSIINLLQNGYYLTKALFKTVLDKETSYEEVNQLILDTAY